MSNETTVFVTFGRNSGEEQRPMMWDEWERFIATVRATITQEPFYGTIFTRGETVGEWNGKREEGYMFGFTVDEITIPTLKWEIGLIGGKFGQESIGFTVHHHRTYGPSYITSIRRVSK